MLSRKLLRRGCFFYHLQKNDGTREARSPDDAPLIETHAALTYSDSYDASSQKRFGRGIQDVEIDAVNTAHTVVVM